MDSRRRFNKEVVMLWILYVNGECATKNYNAC